ncbi:MAG: sulfite exporter TauE/SafE family protein [Limosilactobacillus sp.]
MSELNSIVLLIVIGVMAGITNAAAGLASLVSYPSLLAMGLSPVMANVTSCFSTVASGYSSVVASARELRNNRKQMWIMVPVVLTGAVIGALLLFALPSKWFQELVPICIGLAGIVLIVPHRPRQAHPEMVQNSRVVGRSRLYRFAAWVGIFIVGIYAGYFNAGAGVMMLTLLTVVNRQQSFAVNNALKNVAMTATNTISAIIFAIEAVIYWHYVLPLFIGNIIGGILGPIIVRRLPGRLMQVIVGAGALILAVSLIIRNMM